MSSLPRSSSTSSSVLGPLPSSSSTSHNAGPPPTGFARICGFVSVDYYRPYFDVSTAVVVARIKKGVNPLGDPDIFSTTPDEPIDLYGSVWISTLLVFLIAATSNLNTYLSHAETQEPWDSRDYTLLTLAGTVVYTYAFLIPLIIWASCRYAGMTIPLLKLLAVYAYGGLTPFIVVSVLCVIPSVAVQWILVVIACALSSWILWRNLYIMAAASRPPSSVHAYGGLDVEDTRMGVVGGLVGGASRNGTLWVYSALLVHVAFAVILKIFFFQGADVSTLQQTSAPIHAMVATSSPTPVASTLAPTFKST